MNAVVINSNGRYGFREVRSLYQKYSFIALIVATFLHGAIIGGYYLSGLFSKEEEPVVSVRLMKYSELGPPPSTTNTEAAPQVAVTVPVTKPTIGVPVPVPDAEVSPEQTIATQKELSEVQSPVQQGEGTGGNVAIQQDIKIEDEEPADFVPFEKEPVAVRKIEPKYPDFARRIGAEGTVWIKMWVDKEGKIKKALVVKSDNELFNDLALEAAKQWLFAPAMMNNGPVAVWVTVPFKFKLNK